MIRLLIAEDSQTTRELLVSIFEASGESIEVVGLARHGREAVDLVLRLRPDVVLMDIRMPVMEGFEATRQIMSRCPTPIVIMTAAFNVREVEISMQALRCGAVTLLQKPGLDDPDFAQNARDFVRTVQSMADVKVVRRWNRKEQPADSSVGDVPRIKGFLPRVLTVAASTGGPLALHCLLSHLSQDFPLPILVVQHIAEGFTEGLASWLDKHSALDVRMAWEGAPVRRGQVLLACDDRHLEIKDANCVHCSDSSPVDGFRPSATVLFETAARIFGHATLGLILTGMGNDGVRGLRAIKNAGGMVLAQSEATSVVFGMPGAAVAEGLPDRVLDLDDIAPVLHTLCQDRG